MPITIDLKFGRAEKQLERLNKSVDKLRDVFKEIAELVKAMADDTDRAGRSMRRGVGGGGRGGGGGGGGGGGTTPPVQRFTRGPHQKLLDLAQQRSAAGQISDPTQRATVLKDIQRSEFLAGRSIVLQNRRNKDPNALGGPGLLELFTNLNSKIGGLGRGGGGGAGGGVGGMISSLKGVSGKLGIVGAAVTLLVGAIVTWIAVVKKAASLGANIGAQAAATGGILGNVTASLGAAQFLGTNVAALAGGLAAAGEGGGLAGATQAQLGVSPVPFKFGGPSEGERLAAVQRFALDTSRSPQERQRGLERMGAGGLRGLTQLTKRQGDALESFYDKLNNPEFVERSNDFKISLIGLGAAFQELLVTDIVIDSITGLTVLLRGFARGLKVVGDTLDHPAVKFLIGLTPAGQAINALKRLSEQQGLTDKEITNRTKFMDGLDKHRRMMKEHGEALGGDVRVRRALPPGAAENLIYGGPGVQREIALGLL